MRLHLPGKQKVFGWLGIKKVAKTARCKHYPCAQCWALCTGKVQGCCHLLGGGWGLVEDGCQRKTWEGGWDTRGVDLHPYCKGPYWRKRSSPRGSASADNLINAAVLSASKDLIRPVPAGRSRVQLWEENVFDCKSPCETPLGEQAHRQYQDLQANLWAAGPHGGQWTSGHCICKQVFPSSGMCICCLTCHSFARLFWPVDLRCSKSDDMPTCSCLVFRSKQTWYGGWMQN